VSRLDPQQTIIRLPGDIPWRIPEGAPPHSAEEATLSGGEDEDGAYLVLMKWYPGYMSAPHSYRTDRLCVVVSGTWWCNSGSDFDPGRAVPVGPGGFVHRVARTPHYDGVLADAPEPAVIAIYGTGPVGQTWVDPALPPLRKL
jgi:hypothetical protein